MPVNNQSPAAGRYHSFDALRAAMVLLGLVLHSACSYTTSPIPMVPYHDASTSILFDWLCSFLHIFRLPTFFVMAGFFAALLAARDGPVGMLRNRWRRLMLPLLVGWFILAPLMILALVFALQSHPDFSSGRVTNSSVPAPATHETILMHLWFLYDLFLFCLLATACSFLPQKVGQGFAALFRRLIHSRWAPILFGVATAVTLYPMLSGTFDTSGWLLPPVRILMAYGLFFWFGWLLFGERSLLRNFEQGALLKVISGCLLWTLHACGQMHLEYAAFRPGEPFHLLAIFAGGLACWLMIFGLIGLCLKYLDAPRAWIRYLTDASYWLYLAHLPLVLFLQGTLAPFQLPAVIKFAIVFLIATGFLLVLYDLFVRNSRLGDALSGRRYLPLHSTIFKIPKRIRSGSV